MCSLILTLSNVSRDMLYQAEKLIRFDPHPIIGQTSLVHLPKQWLTADNKDSMLSYLYCQEKSAKNCLCEHHSFHHPKVLWELQFCCGQEQHSVQLTIFRMFLETSCYNTVSNWNTVKYDYSVTSQRCFV